MQYLIDQLGAVIIAGFILMMVTSSNTRMNEFSSEVLYSTIIQREAAEAKSIIEFDFDKIGYNSPTNPIVRAGSTGIFFYSDIITSALPEGDGAYDKVYYYLGSTQRMEATTNPNDMPLYKVSSLHSTRTMAKVTNFNLSYYDSLGGILSYSSLLQATERAKIRSIKVSCSFESSDKIDSVYSSIEWSKVFSPPAISRVN